MGSSRIHGLAIAAALVAAGCEPEFEESMTLGGQEVSAQALNSGREGYMHYCYACHGEKGDGRGPSAPGLRPPPRDFTQARFKFAMTLADDGSQALPSDEDLKRVVKGGLHGTAMLEWEVPEPLLDHIIQYVKTFSPKWQQETPGKPIVDTKDPWANKLAEAVEVGRAVYHSTAQCNSCHPAYATREEITADVKKRDANAAIDFRSGMYQPVLKESDYKIHGIDVKVHILPPDFLFNPMRTGTDVESVYRVIASGVGGTAMPTWKGNKIVTDDLLWAVAHYVKSLADLKDTPGARTLRDRLLSQPK